MADGFESDRVFELWRYTVSMGQLLLRSNRDDERPTRVEVYFQNVDSINLPALMNGLRIELVGSRDYRLSGKDWEGSVDAGLMKIAEDEGRYNDPSALFIGGL